MASSWGGLCVAHIPVGSRPSICCEPGTAVGHQLGKRAGAEECEMPGTYRHLFVTISVCKKTVRLLWQLLHFFLNHVEIQPLANLNLDNTRKGILGNKVSSLTKLSQHHQYIIYIANCLLYFAFRN